MEIVLYYQLAKRYPRFIDWKRQRQTSELWIPVESWTSRKRWQRENDQRLLARTLYATGIDIVSQVCF
jgi:hypothetical protein